MFKPDPIKLVRLAGAKRRTKGLAGFYSENGGGRQMTPPA